MINYGMPAMEGEARKRMKTRALQAGDMKARARAEMRRTSQHSDRHHSKYFLAHLATNLPVLQYERLDILAFCLGIAQS